MLQDQNGKEYMSFRVAVNDTRKGEKTSTFYDVTAVRTGVLDYLKKGQGVIVSCHLSISFVVLLAVNLLEKRSRKGGV